MFRRTKLFTACYATLAFASFLNAGGSIDDLIRSKYDKNLSKDAGSKPAISIQKGDCNFTIGGKTKIEHYFLKNQCWLNSNIPDEAGYIKNTFDLLLDFSFGRKKYGYDAVQAFADIRHKGVWARGAVYADSDATSPSLINLEGIDFGKHSHTNGKPLLWIKDAWLQFSLNAAIKTSCDKLHFLKLGWFPFELGRGIALGSSYGMNRELFGLYNYKEDKSSPGICLNGEIIKNKLTYDLYYSKFEEKGKSIDDTFNFVKIQQVGKEAAPWRGVAKDDDLFAARLKWKAVASEKFGTLELEPYLYYNEASDQKNTFFSDTKTELGVIGLAAEYNRSSLSLGVEVAVNYGNEIVSKIYTDAPGFEIANVGGSKVVAARKVNILAANQQDAYKNKLGGWMGVFDAEYKFDNWDFSLAAAYGYASGDVDPHAEDPATSKHVNKSHKGFIGIHECYTGKRVSSIIMLDERNLHRPLPLREGDEVAIDDMSFTNMHHFGIGGTWTPKKFKSRKVSLNPNVIAFWNAHASKKFDVATGKATSQDASKRLGTELNLKSSVELIKDLSLFGNFAAFIPGCKITGCGLYKDIKGVPFKSDYVTLLGKKLETHGHDAAAVNTIMSSIDKSRYRISNDTAYHVNIGLEYRF
jgi:hypothetical protein